MLATSKPDDVFLIDEVKRRAGARSVLVVVVPPGDIKLAMAPLEAEVTEEVNLDEILGDIEEDDVRVEAKSSVETDLEKEAGESPVIRYVNYIIHTASKEGASDIHIEPGDKSLKVRFRIDGELYEMMQPQAKVKNIMLIEKIGPLIYTAEADRDMIYQVIMNLVSNAIKYTPDAGRVTVTVENDDASRSVLVSVADTGLGIPPDAIGKLFEKFYRVENYKRIAKGTGLGLNLVKHIVETVHRGKVGVTSQVGMGSRFWFTIPYEFQGG